VSERGSYLVGAGILFSRLSGLIRQRVLAHFLGLGDQADAVTAAFRIPNLIQNLFGEGALSASFIPGYSRLVGEGRHDDARRLAGAVLSILALVVALLVVGGELATPFLVDLLVGDWAPWKQALTERLVRILFPGIGLLVFSAWCLGILNSHGKFFLSYAAPVIWNLAIIVAILAAPADQFSVVIWASWGAVLGSALQVLVQVPTVFRQAGRVTPGGWTGVPELGAVLRTFLPALVSRGALQIAAYIDLLLAGFLPSRAVAALTNAQILYTLPVSLFGMAVSAAELPAMAREQGDAGTVAAALRIRLDAATQRLAYYIVPSAMAFLAFGGVLAAAIYQGGAFTAADSRYVWLILAGSAFGLLAATLGRLYSSAFYALRDAVTPLRCGLVRIALTAGLGAFGALVAPGLLGVPAAYGAAGITLAGGIAGWIEFALLRRVLCRRLGRFALPLPELAKLWGAATIGAAVATAVRLATASLAPVPQALLVVPAFGLCYVAITWWLDVPESAVLVRKWRRSSPGGQ
jgi:putative peptidoglycan lipid II flippase